jgi:hypothetical protein
MERKRKGYFERDLQKTGYRNKSPEEEWCKGRFLQLKALKDLEKSVEELKFNLERNRVIRPSLPNRTPLSWEEKVKYLQISMTGAFFPNYFVRSYGTVDMKEVDKVRSLSTLSVTDAFALRYLNGAFSHFMLAFGAGPSGSRRYD